MINAITNAIIDAIFGAESERRTFLARCDTMFPSSGGTATDALRIKDALDLAIERCGTELRASGESAWMHDLRVATTLVDLGMDADSVIAGLLHDLHELAAPAAEPEKASSAEGVAGKVAAGKDTHPRHEERVGPKKKASRGSSAHDDAAGAIPEIARRFGDPLARLVSGVSRLGALRATNRTVHAAESIRKMLFAMTADIRVMIVKLADKLDSMRTLHWLPEERQKEIATECLDIYAPLADRLGVSWIKDELEDLALEVINGEAFEQIKDIVAERQEERETFLARVEATLTEAAAEEGMALEVHARAKHFYSIYQKMRRRAKGAEELFDLFGVRLICTGDNDCYALLGLVHRLWKPIDGRFKDYIAMPKANGYRSLHTTVMCYEGRLLEVQIRTREMHQVAEFGVASHWLYKKGTTAELPRAEDLPIMNRLREWTDFLSSGADFLDEIKRELLKDSIFVFTPLGDVIQLPTGAGPLDFAYAIHSDVGMHCVGAKADGHIISLDGELRNTQVVEILTSPAAHPTMNWLSLAKTSKARAKIRSWLVQTGQVLAIDKSIIAGQRPPSPERPEERRAHAPHATAEDLVVEVDSRTAAAASPGEAAKLEFRSWEPGEALRNEKAGVAIDGQRGLVIRIAGCCRPVTGDPIAGYVSRGRGIIVHRADCRTLRAIPDFAERGIEVHWENLTPFVTARFRLTARRSAELFSEIEAAVRKFQGHLREGRLGARGDGNFEGSFTMEVEKREDVRKVIKAVRSIPSVLTIEED